MTSEPGDRTAFFYGTLMVPQILHRVIFYNDNPPASVKSILTIRQALLENYSRRAVRYATYPGIIPQKDSWVLGTYVTGLTDQHIQRLDRFEGDQYTRKHVKVRLLEEAGEQTNEDGTTETRYVEGQEVDAETYEWSDSLANLEDAEWDFQEFKETKLHRWVRTNEEYADVDAAAEDDRAGEKCDPTGGRGVNGPLDPQKATEAKVVHEITEEPKVVELSDSEEDEVLQSAV